MAQTPATETTYVPDATVTHKGQVITVVRKFRPAYTSTYTNSVSGVTTTHDNEAWEIWEASVDGKAWYGLGSSKSPQDAVARAKRAIDRIAADEAIYDSLQAYVGRVDVTLGQAERGEDGKLRKPVISTNVTPAGEVKVGDHVVTYTRGYWRRVIVAKVGRRNVEVAYVTSLGGQMTRKSVPASAVYREVVA